MYVENPRNLLLPSEAEIILRDMFAGYSRVTIKAEFGGGFSGSRVFLVRPIRDDGAPELPAVVKLAPRQLIEQEWHVYQATIHDRLPGVAEIRGEPIVLSNSDWGGLRYPLVGGGTFEIESLYQYYRHASVEDIRFILTDRLFKQMGAQWRVNYPAPEFHLQPSYDHLLPVNLRVRPSTPPASAPIRAIRAGTSTRLPVSRGEYVRLVGFAITETDPAIQSIALNRPARIGDLPASYRVRLQPVERIELYRVGERVEMVEGEVTATRYDLLRDQVQQILGPEFDPEAVSVTLPDGSVLPNPLAKLETILAESLNVKVADIHGDLNPENILIDPATREVRLIDFAMARRDHVLHDLLRLETGVITRLMPEAFAEANLPPEAIYPVYEYLHAAAFVAAPAALPEPPHRALEKPLAMLVALRLTARTLLFDPAIWEEYYQGLTIYLLGAQKYGNLDQAARRISFWGAASAQSLIEESHATLEEAKARPLWASLPPPPCPYRGLLAFREEDALVFFGRRTFVAELVRAAERQSFVAVIGSSGSGKSSVVFAGLLPHLRGSGNWLIADFRLGRSPFQALAAALLPLLEPQMSETDRILESNKLARALSQGDLTLAQVVGRVLQKHPDRSRLLLVADQLEELYTQCPEPEKRHRFLDQLSVATAPEPDAGGLPITLVLTLRADFLGQALGYRPFADALQSRDLKLGPMNREELRQAIELPANNAGVSFEAGLVERILDDVGTEPGNLPLLEFALTLLWERQANQRMTHAAYEEVGRVEGALARRADEEYERLRADEAEQARRLLVQLVQPGVDTEDTRRVATRAELGGVTWDLVQQLANARLVVTGQDAHGLQTVEIAHEALIQRWGRLREWMAEDRSFRAWQERLRVALSEWQASRQDSGALLRGGPLAEAEDWHQKRAQALSESEHRFIQASRALRNRQERLRRLAVIGSLVVAIIMIFLALSTGAALQAESRQAATAEAARATSAAYAALVLTREAEAREGQAQGRLARARELAAQSVELLEADTKTSLLLAVQAVSTTYEVDGTYAIEAQKALSRALAASRTLFSHTPSEVYSATNTSNGKPIVTVFRYNSELQNRINFAGFSPDGTRIVTAGNDGTARLWDADGNLITLLTTTHRVWAAFSPDGARLVTAQEGVWATLWDKDVNYVHTLTGGPEGVYTAEFSPDGTRVVGGGDGVVRLWDAEGNITARLRGHTAAVNSTIFSPDGKRILTASDDGTARLWDAEGNSIAILEGHTAAVNCAVFSPDGKRILTASDDGTARLWDAEGNLITVLEGHTAAVNSAVFSRDGQRILTASDDHTARSWDAEGNPITVLEGHTAAVNSAVFSPDDRYILTGSSDGTARLWDAEGDHITVLEGHTGAVNSAVFSPDGARIVTASDDNTARLWDVNGNLLMIMQHTSRVLSVAFSPDSSRFVTASADGATDLWDVNGQLIRDGLDGVIPLTLAAFSPDGMRIVTISQPRTVQLWDLSGNLLAVMRGHAAGVWGVEFSPDSQRILTASYDDTAQLWDAEGNLITVLEVPGPLNSAVLSPDGRRILTASGDRTAQMWDTEGNLITTLKGHTDAVYSAVFSPDGSYILTAGKDHTARRWDTAGNLLNVLDGHTDEVNSAVFSRDGRRIVTASKDGTARLWDAEGNLIAVLQGHMGEVYLATFSPDGRHIATAGADRTARIWDVEGNLVAILEGHTGVIVSAVFSPDGRRIVIAEFLGGAKVWEADIEGMLAAAHRQMSLFEAASK